MKNRILLTLLCVISLVASVQANDYLEQQKHYTVMSIGEGVLRFYIPVWVYGRANDYYLWGSYTFTGSHDSYIWYKLAEGSDQSIHRIASVAGVQRGLNTASEDIGEGYIYIHTGSGIVRSTYDGQEVVLTEGDRSHWMQNSINLKRKNDDDHKRITYITFDWYPPASLTDKKFKWGVSAAIYKQSSGNESYYYNWEMPDVFKGGDIPQTPQLYEPYLYTLDADGSTGFGNAGIQYVVFQDPASYHTSLNPKERETSDRSGTIVVPTKDSVQRFFSATFQTYKNKNAQTKQTLKTNEVHIPAYHRVYNLRATEELDANQRVTGKVNLSWEVHNPAAKELIEGDVFEIQRAFQSDFSDAQTIGVMPYSEDSLVYRYPDNPLQAMREAEATMDTLEQSFSKSCTVYTYDEEGYCVNTYTCKLTSNKLLKPGRPVYYRVRRASSSIWGWKHDFAKVDSVIKNNYLAPLAADQPDYSLDPDFDNNRKVHLYFNLSNQPVAVIPDNVEQCEYKTELVNNATLVELQIEPMFSGQVPESEIQNYIYELSYTPPGEDSRAVYHEFTFDHFGERKQHIIPTDSRHFQLRVKYTGYNVGKVAHSIVPIARVGNSYTITVAPGRNPLYIRELNRSDDLTDSIKQAWATPLNNDSLRSALYSEIQKELAYKYPTGEAYCNWDNNARLWVRRTLVETGEMIETPVPADSVKIAEDGSWSIHTFDIADRSCVHYQYEVRLDQTNSSLKVMNLNDLRPKRLSGPDIYYNSTGKIESVQATQGSDRYGVQITWKMGPGGVDDYLIERREQGAQTYDSLTVVDVVGFRDIHTATDKHYDYRIISRYTCNGTTTTDTAACTGWRSPYGKIEGRVHYTNGMGCADVEVRLTAQGSDEIWTTTTNAAGEYVFDNLLYGAGTEYAVTPTSTYATFRFNNSSVGSASVTLSQDNPVASGLLFENISSVRFSGRVLYENTTIPVRDANLLLDGKMVSTDNAVYKTDGSGNFTIQVPLNHPFSIQVIKPGHTFAGEGFVRIDGDSVLRLEKALDGVRIYDRTRVRLTGRMVGGQNQADKILGFGLSTNNLGDDLQLVLELEGDNISQIVHDPQDPTLDTIRTTVKQYAVAPYDTLLTGTTQVIYSKKRIIIRPDQSTGEYCADLCPVKYKITQATAKGYATLYADGKTSETLDLMPAVKDTLVYTHNDHRFTANALYSITYHSPIDISCKQLQYGMEVGYYGEEDIERQSIDNTKAKTPLATQQADKTWSYLFGHPVFSMGKYSFRASAHEDYYYNNNPLSVRHEEVRIKNGLLKVYNGLYDAPNTQIQTIRMDANGEALFTIPVDYVSFVKTGESALRPLDLSVEYQGNYVEKQAFRAYVMGNRAKGKDFVTSTTAAIVLLDVLRDPPGSNSTAYVESGTTYKYSYSSEVKFTFGMDVMVGYGTSTNTTFGTYNGAGAGSYYGFLMNMSTVNKINIPIKSTYYSKHGATYTFGVNERIETEADHGHTGEMDDIYIGGVQNLYYGLTDAVKPIDSLTYAAFAPQFANGSMQVVDSARAADGKKWYLAIGLEREVGTYMTSTFSYTHDYIENTLLPKLKRDRDALLLTLDSATVQSMANAQKKYLYWSKVAPESEHFASKGYYRQIRPAGVIKVQADEVAGYNNAIAGWIDVMIQNENEKINAIHGYGRNRVGTWSVSGGSKVSYNENYEYSNAYSKYVDYPGASANLGQGLITGLGNMFGQTVAEMIGSKVGKTARNEGCPYTLAGEAPEAKWSFELTPILNLDYHQDPSNSESSTRKAGFTLRPDGFGYMDVSVYRAIKQEGFNHEADSTLLFLDQKNTDYKYGSFVYYLNGGASRCPWEPADSTHFYEPKLPLGNGTLNLENQKIDIDVHERSNVPVDKAAVFNLRMSNESEHEYGGGQEGIAFVLKLNESSNPKGVKILIDGIPLSGDGRTIKLAHGQIVNKTMEVYAGQGYDFENITLELVSPCDRFNKARCTFSVHYMPVSCEVNIAAPHDKWVMNTLSPQDSAGYYLPVVIDGFDVNYKNFDHIELQYKLSKHSDDGWVNLCSYYAEDSLYNEASGTKAMITGGRIENIRFYGERDPMEQEYDLRAVSFCRHGNSYISRASEVRSGIKDTRVPRVFGAPQPADAILGVGNDLKLRFNEAIAGNYLDEDNNFQIIGRTNATGITTGTSLHFADEADSKAVTKVERSLTDMSFTIDMMVRPQNAEVIGSLFFTSMPNYNYAVQLGCENGSLALILTNETNSYVFRTERGVLPSGVFSRVIAVYDNDRKTVQFYVGTKPVPCVQDVSNTIPNDFVLRGSAPFEFGGDFEGDLLEARVWTKALTQDEISATHMKYLTGYERDLLAYYRMDEGRGNVLTDKANGATLYSQGTTWQHRKGISVALKGNEALQLAGNLLGRSAAYDESIMLWFKAVSPDGSIFSAGRTDDKHGTLLALENGRLVLHSDSTKWLVGDGYANSEWHHMVLTINRTLNNAAVYVDGKMLQSFSAALLGGISGAMYLGGDGFEGNIDDLVFFEQALPKYMVEGFDNLCPTGSEMGIFGFLPFEEMKENANGIIELVYSPNDQREFRDGNKNVINKVVPLVMTSNSERFADKTSYAPTRDQGMMTKMNFDWAFNGDELLINLNMADREINKQTIYVTVRDVEDLNGNPMASPVSWVAFVDRNALKWSERTLLAYSEYENIDDFAMFIRIVNTSGRHHQYSIESLPDWMTVKEPYGSMNALEEKDIRLDFKGNMPVGVYSDLIYLTDEEGLAEPLAVEYTVEAHAPYEDVNLNQYTMNMSVCAQVKIDDAFDTDERDIVYAIYNNKCVGQAHITVNTFSNTSDVYLTAFGDDKMVRKEMRFQLWQASTGKLLNLIPSRRILFAHGYVYGCGDEDPVLMTVSGSETQNIALNAGWNWISTNLKLQPETALLNSVMTAAEPWKEKDRIKCPATRQFSIYSEASNAFVGELTGWDYKQMYMVNVANSNTMRLNGDQLSEADMQLTLRGDGQWNAFPCLLNEATNITEAMSGYFNDATPGDMVKAHNRFSVYSKNKQWIGDLTTLRPGEGYLMKRMGQGTVTVKFYNKSAKAPRRSKGVSEEPVSGYDNPKAATNMTMIAKLSNDQINEQMVNDQMVNIMAYIGDELVGVATPITYTPSSGTEGETLYFITISSDAAGEVRFETEDGTILTPYTAQRTAYIIHYTADAHHGAITEPVLLQPAGEQRPYKIIEDQHVVIIRNNEKYGIDGKKLQ